MKRMGVLLLVVLSLTSTAAAGENLCFKSLCLTETTYEECEKTWTLCEEKWSPLGDQSCTRLHSIGETIAGVPVAEMSAHFFDKRLHYLSMYFPSDQYETVLADMTERYGKPTRTDTETFQNRMGATFERRTFTWGDPSKQIISLEEYGVSLDKSRVTYQTGYSLEEFARRKRGDGKKNANDK